MKLSLLETFYETHQASIRYLIECAEPSQIFAFQLDDERIKLFIQSPLLQVKENQYIINDTEVVLYSISKLLLEKYHFNIPTNFEERIEAFENIKEILKKKRQFQLFYKLIDKIIIYELIRFNQEHGLDIAAFTKNFLSKHENHIYIYELSQWLGGALPEIQLSGEQFIFVLNSLVTDKTIDSLYDLFEGFRNYCKINADGKSIWKYLTQNVDKRYEGAITRGLLGLYARNPIENFELFPELFQNKELLYAGIHAARFTEVFSTDHLRSLLEMICVIEPDNVKILSQQCYFFQKICSIESFSLAEHEQAARKLLSYSKAYDIEHQKIVINSIVYSAIKDELKYEIIENVNLTNKEVFDYLSNASFNFTDVSYIFKVIKLIILKSKKILRSEYLDYNIRSAMKKCRIISEKNIIQLLMDDIGLVRWTAFEIVNRLEILFDSDFCTYSEKEQQRLIQSLTPNCANVALSVKLILPFRKSQYESVIHLLTVAIGQILRDYLESAVEAFDTVLQETDELDKVWLEYVHRFKSELYKYIDLKRSIHEFDPTKSMVKEYTDFYQMWQSHFGKSIPNGMENNSFAKIAQFATQIRIARGSGFRSSSWSNSEIAPMQSMRYDISLPRTYFIAPEHYDFNQILTMLANYKINL